MMQHPIASFFPEGAGSDVGGGLLLLPATFTRAQAATHRRTA